MFEHDQSPDHVAQLEQLKRASTSQVLFKVARLLNELSIEHIRRSFDLPKLRAAHTTLFPHIDLEGTRITEIASRLGVSKQAVAQLVDELVEMGSLERIPDPSDGRAKLVRFGPNMIEQGLAQLMLVEQGLKQILGEDSFGALRGALLVLLDTLEEQPEALLSMIEEAAKSER